MDSPTADGSRVAGNAAALLGGRIATAIVGLLTVPPLYGLLGQRRFGLWVLLLGAIAILGLFDLGLGSAQVREVARATGGGDPRLARAVLALGMLTVTALGLVFCAATAVAWPMLARAFDLGSLTQEGRAAALLLVASLVVDGLASPWRGALEGTQRFRSVAFIVATVATVGGVAGVAMVAAGHGLRGLGWSVLGASILRFWLVLVTARRSAPDMRPSLRAIDPMALRSFVRYGWRVQLSNAAAAINNDTDRLVLGTVYSPSAVAPFDLGSRMANVLRLLPTFVLIAVFPAAAAMHAEGDRARMDRLYLRTTRCVAVFAFIAAAALVVGASPLVVLWLGQPVPMAVATIALLAPGYAVNLTSGAASAITRAEGAPERETRYALLGAGLNVVLTVPLLLVLGPLGVPFSTTLAYVIATAYFFRHFHRASKRPLRPVLLAIWKPFAAAGFAAVVSWLSLGRGALPPGRLAAAFAVAGRGGLVAALSLAMLAVMRFFDQDDRDAAARVLARLRPKELAPAPVPATRGLS